MSAGAGAGVRVGGWVELGPQVLDKLAINLPFTCNASWDARQVYLLTPVCCCIPPHAQVC